jgi:hypothetical protein
MVIQYLDDVCGAAPQGCLSLERFLKAYKDFAADTGIQLAPDSDPDKAFSCTMKGVVLGVLYDTENWTWSIPQEKLARVLHQLRTAIDADTLAQHQVWSLVGRVLHYAPLVPSGRFNIVHLISANSNSIDRNASHHDS